MVTTETLRSHVRFGLINVELLAGTLFRGASQGRCPGSNDIGI